MDGWKGDDICRELGKSEREEKTYSAHPKKDTT